MNIFFVHENPVIAAQSLVDRHCVKMILESTQLLSTAHRLLDGKQITINKYVNGSLPARWRKVKRWQLMDKREDILYQATHINHPSAIWARTSVENYNWLLEHLFALITEYNYRYGKIHACARLKDMLRFPPTKIRISEFFAPTPAMPGELKVLAENPVPGRKYDSLKSYHKYYLTEKIRFAKWKNRNIPEWFKTNASI